MMANQMESRTLVEAIQGRRSIRAVTNSPKVEKERIDEIVTLALHAPSAFNMQSGRLVVLMDESHEQLWALVKETLQAIVPADSFSATEARLQGFKDGLGTVLFFEDQATVDTMKEKAPLYKEHFNNWSQQGSGMLQYAVWLALSAEGFGVSLQHYNPLIDNQVKEKWSIPQQWTLIGQMPFGWPAEQPGERSFLPHDEVVKFY
ncbi:nitroreductase family protein [Paenibacillus profundus]